MGWAAAGLAAAALGYASHTAWVWLRYGRRRRVTTADADPLLDRCMPEYDVSEKHRIHVNAPAATTFAVAGASSLGDSCLIQAIVRTRALVLGAKAPAT